MKRLLNTADELLDKTILFSYTNVGYYLRRPRWHGLTVDLRGKVCLVTGANAGLGKVVAAQLAGMGAAVHMICRSPERGEVARQEILSAGNDQVFLHLVDLSLQSDIRAFAEGFASERVDVLVNNAGVMVSEREETAENIERTFATNVLGYLLLTELLLPKLKNAAAARVINVTSGGMYAARLHIDDLLYEQRPYDGVKAYAESKRAEVIMTQLWAQTWRDTNIAVHSAHPGWAATPGVARSLPRFDRLMGPFLRSPEQGADTILWLSVRPDLHEEPNGKFWFDRQIRPEHKRGVRRNTAAEIAAFWRLSQEMAGLTVAA